MKFLAASQIYCPVWLFLRWLGYTYSGMAAGALLVVFLWSMMWRVEFRTWKFWGDC